MFGIVEGSIQWKHSRIEILSRQRGISEYANAKAGVVWGEREAEKLKRNTFYQLIEIEIEDGW